MSMFQHRKNYQISHLTLMRNLRHLSACLMAGMVVCGCGHGGGGFPFTGGGFPNGLNTRMSGRLVHADNSLLPLANAAITLTVSTPRFVLAQLQATSAVDGTFSFPAIPTGAYSVSADIDIVPADRGEQEQKFKFALMHDQPVQLIAALPPASFDISQAASVTLTLSRTTVPTAVNIPFVTKVIDNQGNTISLSPSLLFYGGFGSIGIENTFYATSSGSGQMIAIWSSTLHSAAVNITADENLKHDMTPPPAP